MHSHIFLRGLLWLYHFQKMIKRSNQNEDSEYCNFVESEIAYQMLTYK